MTKVKTLPEAIAKLKVLFSKEENWCQGDYAIDKNGKSTNIDISDAVKFCLWGGICHITEPETFVRRNLYMLVVEKCKDTIATFNDTHEFEDIKKLVCSL